MFGVSQSRISGILSDLVGLMITHESIYDIGSEDATIRSHELRAINPPPRDLHSSRRVYIMADGTRVWIA